MSTSEGGATSSVNKGLVCIDDKISSAQFPDARVFALLTKFEVIFVSLGKGISGGQGKVLAKDFGGGEGERGCTLAE